MAGAEAGDARLRALDARLPWALVLLGATFTLGFFALFCVQSVAAMWRTGAPAAEIDFRVFWSAARLSLAGEALALAKLGTLLYGIGYWEAWFAALSGMMDYIKAGGHVFTGLIGVFPFLLKAGVPPDWAPLLQAGLLPSLAALVWRAWSRPGASFDLRVAVLLSVMPLAQPYLWWYDFAIFSIVPLFMIRAGILPLNWAGMAFLVLVWTGASFQQHVLTALMVVALALSATATLMPARRHPPQTPG
jgi:hypothetical protein